VGDVVTADPRGLDAQLVVHRPGGFSLDLTLGIGPGETVALLGPNGAGKSTAVDALAGLVPLDDGHLVLDGRTLDDPRAGVYLPPEERRLGVVFQDYLLFDHLSVTDNVVFGLTVTGTGRRRARSRADRWLDELDLTALANRHPPELSGGQAQRVALARALAVEPDLLLLDEPMAALDVATRSDLRRRLARHLDRFPGPRLLITHDPTDAFLLADRIHVVEEGRLTQVGAPDDIRRRPATPYVAALAGTNLLTGANDGGLLDLDEHPLTLRTADTHTTGRVLITIHPTAVALHPDQPHGSPRNTWPTTIVSVEALGETNRIVLGSPLPLGVDVTPAASEALGLRPGSRVWASVKATEIVVEPAG
jgi:molybdate transport system ATP-binding protein